MIPMYAEFHPVDVSGRTASTPEVWAARFAKSARLNKWRELRLGSWLEMKLIRRYIPPGARVLDAGCGYGEWVTLLRKRGYDAEGLDYSKGLVDRLKVEYPGTRWHLGDIRHLGDDLGTFDALISWGVIEHDPDGPGAALRELARILRPGGIGIFTVPRDDEANRAATRKKYPPTPGAEFFQFYMTEAELAESMRGAGFDVVETGTTRMPSLDLVFPRTAGAPRTRLFGAAQIVFAFAARFFTRRYDGIIYCVARKGGNA